MKQNMKEAIGLSLKRYNDTYMKAANDRIDNIVSQAGTDNTEIVDARIDSAGVTHTTLNNRILAETKMNDQHLVSCSGEYITAENTMGGSITNLEVLGNTIQNEEDLADIKSVGELQEDGTYKMSILSCGKNLFNPLNKNIECSIGGSQNKVTYKVEGDKIIIKSNPSVSSDWGWVEFKNIKVTPNKSYTIHPNATVIKGNVCVFVFDSNNTKLFEIPNTSKTFIPTTKHITIRLYVQTTTSYTDAEIHYKPQLEEGTQATPYEPYQENKCDILLPCQFEKVGDVADRLYYDDVEKAWCIEKNVETKEDLTILSWVTSDTSKTETIMFRCSISDRLNGILNLLNNRIDVKNVYSLDEEGVFGSSSTTDIYFRISKTTCSDLDSFKQYLKNNNVLFKYQLATPQKIVLPLDVQIQLNSFFGTTHVYMESGEVEGTIKCKIPKSLGATVQSLNNKTDILSDRIEAIEGLKDSQNMKYETDKGYLVCKETKNGVIDDLKIEGKTLVNYISNFNNWRNLGSTTVSGDGVSMTINATAWNKGREISKNLPSGNYIFRVTNPNKATIVIQDKTNARILLTSNDANVDFEFTLSSSIELLIVCKNTSETGTYVVSNPILTTDKNFNNYFEGLMSVGEDVDKIEVLSNNGNLFDMSRVLYGKSINSNNGDIATTPDWCVNEEFIPVVKGVPLYISRGESISNASSTKGYIYVYQYNKNKVMIGRLEVGTTSVTFTPTINGFIRVALKYDKLIGFGLYRQPNISMPHQSDKKQILFYNENGELEPIQELHEWDSIEKHSDNKWYYHKRSGKVVLNGSEDENWTMENNTNTIRFVLSNKLINPIIKQNNLDIVCDKFNAKYNFNLDEEGIFINTRDNSANSVYIRLLKTKLSTQDVTGFKQWLQANNVTVVYQLAEEKVYELAPLHLDSYANETLILCNSGAISPRMEFSITSHINELVKAYGERVNLLEEKVYQYMVTQNRMQLASTYSADSVTFKVDYFSLCGDEENYDEDLYNLILNNILVGKDNYDYDKMFTIILDYASWNQISWEQFDILVGLMDIQHNPPVEELPTEDEIEEIPNEIE